MLYFWIHNYLIWRDLFLRKKGQFLDKDHLLSDKISPSPNYFLLK